MKGLDVASFAQAVRTVVGLIVLACLFAGPARAQDDPPAADPPGDAASEPVAEAAAEKLPPARVYMPDGQLKSHSIRVYVNREIPDDQDPRLELLRSHVVTEETKEESRLLEPKVVAPGQEWVESIDGQEVRRSGTLLMFDLRNQEFGYKGTLRVTPIVSWNGEGGKELAVGPEEVNVANILNIAGWTLAVVIVALGLVILLARRDGGRAARLLIGAHGHLSLAQAQIACWTFAVGGIVLGYGFVRLQIPEIPMSLLVLMGASLTTGGVAFFQDERKARNAPAAPGGPPGAQPELLLRDLVRTFTPGQASELSLAKAQMLFWTVLLLVLFISKSILDGTIWAVPWPLVGLMGFSQAGYLAPKIAPES